MEVETTPKIEEPFYAKYIPLAVWFVAIVLGLLIPLKILSLGYMPPDDAMRHVAKALSGKSWPEILVMDPRFAQDEHPGWHAILGALHRLFNWNADQLMFFSIFAPFVLFWSVMLFIRKRPEAMVITIFAATVLVSGFLTRFLIGRPFIVMLSVYLLLIHLWATGKQISTAKAIISILLIGFSVWVHGSWYLFGFVLSGFLFTREYKKLLIFFSCWLLGSILGASLTGHPYNYLKETTIHLLNCFGGQIPGSMLVAELRPGSTDFFFMVIILALLWRIARREWKTEAVWTSLFVLALVGWILGYKVQRFWTDWGFPAAMLWLMVEIEGVLQSALPLNKLPTLLLTCFAAVGCYFGLTSDIGSRWTANLEVEYITPKTAGINDWLPGNDGIVYSPDMTLFFRMFYANPTASWRYALGFEPGIMTPENFQIFQMIQLKNSIQAYNLWVARMRPQDRLILLQDEKPPINLLDWYRPVNGTWIGRLSQTNMVPGSK